MGPLTRQLLELLPRLVELLRADEDEFWSTKVEDCRERIAAGDFGGVEQFLGLCGGMGSLNDRSLSNATAHREFEGLLSRGYDLARAIQRDQ